MQVDQSTERTHRNSIEILLVLAATEEQWLRRGLALHSSPTNLALKLSVTSLWQR